MLDGACGSYLHPDLKDEHPFTNNAARFSAKATPQRSPAVTFSAFRRVI
jgi:hypothetical protein